MKLLKFTQMHGTAIWALGLIIVASSGSSLARSPEEVQRMNPEQRRQFYSTLPNRWSELTPQDMVTLVGRGIKDSDPETQVLALRAIASLALAQQEMKGRVPHFPWNTIPEIRDVLESGVHNANPNLQAWSMRALAHVYPSDPGVERLLINQWESLSKPPQRAFLLRVFQEGKFSSETVKNLILASLQNPQWIVAERAANAAASLGMKESLPTLVEGLSKNDPRLTSFVTAIGSFGAEAKVYQGALESLLEKHPEKSPLHSALERALQNLKGEKMPGATSTPLPPRHNVQATPPCSAPWCPDVP